MDASPEFTIAGDTMDFALKRILEGHPTPPALFTEIIVEKMSAHKLSFLKYQRPFTCCGQCQCHHSYNNTS